MKIYNKISITLILLTFFLAIPAMIMSPISVPLWYEIVDTVCLTNGVIWALIYLWRD